MSHGDYSFLMKTEGETPEEIKDEIEPEFSEYLERHCDENNWSHLLYGVRNDGLLIPLCRNEGGKGWDGGQVYVATIPEAKRYTEAMRFALGCVAVDMYFRDVSPWALCPSSEKDEILEKMSFEELRDAILDEMPPHLVKAYESFKRPKERFDMENYHRRKAVRIFEKFVDSTGPGNVCPFHYPVSPYEEYRAMHFGNPEEANTIFVADIHT